VKKYFKLTSFLCLSALFLIGCQTTGSSQAVAVLQPDSAPLTTSELYSYFSEKTQARDNGGVYYTEFGTITSLEDGNRFEGTWASYDGGKLCRLFDDRENSPCEIYYNNGDVVSMMTGGEVSEAPKIYKGNKLDFLETGSDRKIFTKEETIALVSGKTHPWENNNGAYYAADGKLITLWDGQKETGKWSVTDKGALCWHISSWGKTPCESFFMGLEGLMTISKGKEDNASDFRDGNVLNSL
jgi:hypothetical protein